MSEELLNRKIELCKENLEVLSKLEYQVLNLEGIAQKILNSQGNCYYFCDLTPALDTSEERIALSFAYLSKKKCFHAFTESKSIFFNIENSRVRKQSGPQRIASRTELLLLQAGGVHGCCLLRAPPTPSTGTQLGYLPFQSCYGKV